VQINRHHIQSPTEIITLHLGIPPEYKQQCIDEIYNLGDSQSQQTNIKAIMTSYQIWNESKIFNMLLNNIKNIISNIEPMDKRWEFVLKDAWGAIYKKDSYTVCHWHYPFQTSFVYYLQSSGNTPLIFNGCDFQINPIDDMLVVFPSYLFHSVPKHNEEEDRVCIAGNLIWKPIE
jgi:hypothetical protein